MTAPGAFRPLAFFATPPHQCSYLADREAVTVFADPEYPKDRKLYSILTSYGFRRSGQHIYKPRCPDCNACIPLRLPVSQFKPRRSQRRAWRNNDDLRIVTKSPQFSYEHFQLYRRYLDSRHKGGGMDDPNPRQYLDFLTSSWSDTVFYEFRLGTRLLAIGVIDCVEDGLSIVYTFFDPDYSERSLGVYTILWEIEEAKRLGLKWLYLGYWIKESGKMRYKTDFQPLEYLRDGTWRYGDTEKSL